MDEPRTIFTDEHRERMSTKLRGKLLCSITGDLAHSVKTRRGVVLEEKRVVVILIVIVWGGFRIKERVIMRVLLEFRNNVDARNVRYDGWVFKTSRYIMKHPV